MMKTFFSILCLCLLVIFSVFSVSVCAQEQENQSGLLNKLKNGTPEEQQIAVLTLGNTSDFDKKFDRNIIILALLEILKNPAKPNSLRADTASSLGNIAKNDKDTIDLMVKDLEQNCTQDIVICTKEIDSLGKIAFDNKEVIKALVNKIKEAKEKPFLRQKAVEAIGYIGVSNNDAIKVLCDLLNNSAGVETFLRISAATALGKIAPSDKEAERTLIKILDEMDMVFQLNVYGEPMISPQQAKELNLTKGLRHSAISALVAITQDNKTINDDLIKNLEREKDPALIPKYALFYSNTAKQIALSKNIEQIDRLSDIRKQLISARNTIPNEKNASPNQSSISFLNQFDNSMRDFDSALSTLSDIKNAQIYGKYIKWIENNSYILSIIIGLIILLWIWLLILWIHPIWLLYINNSLSKYSVKLPDWLGGISIHVGYVLLVGFFHFHPRVMDAWVESNINQAWESFNTKQTVRERKIFIPTNVTFDLQDLTTDLRSEHFHNLYVKGKSRLLIWGEPGLGKTSLACQLLKWGMHESNGMLCPTHKILPILIEREIKKSETPQNLSLFDNIRHYLTEIINAEESPTDDFIRKLLIKRRVIVAIDGYSEMDKTSQEEVTNGVRNIPVNAVIFTSRIKENLSELFPQPLQPQQIKSTHLYSFLSSYAKAINKKELFNDEVIKKTRHQLLQLSGNRDLTPLLATIYTNEAISHLESETETSLPTNIPDLWLNYINRIHRSKDFNVSEVQKVLQRLAWECLKEDYRPKPIKRDTAEKIANAELTKPNAPSETPNGARLLEYLEKELLVFCSFGVEKDFLGFSFDSLSEYLAGVYLIKHCNANQVYWDKLFDDMKLKVDSSKLSLNHQGFFYALSDCLEIKGNENKVAPSNKEKLNHLLTLLSSPSVNHKISTQTPEVARV